jgi:hypothetical protein
MYGNQSGNMMMMHQGMMGMAGGGLIGVLISIAILVDLILVGILLWKKVNRKEK